MTSKNLERALAARRESRRVAFRKTVEDWDETLRHVAALANSGGGVVLFFSSETLAPQPIIDRLNFTDFEVVLTTKDSQPVVALVVGEAPTPIVFNSVAWFRHGARSEPATTEDLAAFIEKRVQASRKTWLGAVRRVLHAPERALSTEVRESESPTATPIRVVEDPKVAAYRLIDYDKTHPYRQKELVAALRERLPGRAINQFDVLSIRKIHETDARAEFAHKSLFGTRQYSQRFVDWLVEQTVRDPGFFETAKREYTRRRSKSR